MTAVQLLITFSMTRFVAIKRPIPQTEAVLLFKYSGTEAINVSLSTKMYQFLLKVCT